MKILVIILSILVLSSCKQSQKNQIENSSNIQNESQNLNQTKDSVEIGSKSEERDSQLNSNELCECFDGIGSMKGDEPILRSSFSNGKLTAMCGYYDKEMKEPGLIISEFNIFDCETEKAIVEYGAIQICRIKEGKDSIIIEELKYLPAGNNWEWELIQIAEQIVTLENQKLVALDVIPKFQKIKINLGSQTQFLNSIKQGEGINEKWVEELCKLEILSLNGNAKAWKILKNYEEFKGDKTDGALAEQWKDALANVEWIKNE